MAAAIAAVILVLLTGRADSAVQTTPKFGSLWLPSPGTVILVDGTVAKASGYQSGAIAYPPIVISKTGDPLQVSQVGATAYVADQAAGTVTRIDGATFAQTKRSGLGPGVRVFASPNTVFAVEPAKDQIEQLDPETLGSPKPTSARLGVSSPNPAVLDADGTLWWLDRGLGRIRSLRAGALTTGDRYPGGSQLTLAAGRPVLVETTTSAVVVRAVRSDDTLAESRPVSAVSGAAVTGGSDRNTAYLADSRSGKLVAVAVSNNEQPSVNVASSGDVLLPPVEALGRVFVADVTRKQIVVADASKLRVISSAQFPRLTKNYQFQVSDEGIVYYNDPTQGRAGVLSPSGAPRPTRKATTGPGNANQSGQQSRSSQSNGPNENSRTSTPTTTSSPTQTASQNSLAPPSQTGGAGPQLIPELPTSAGPGGRGAASGPVTVTDSGGSPSVTGSPPSSASSKPSTTSPTPDSGPDTGPDSDPPSTPNSSTASVQPQSVTNCANDTGIKATLSGDNIRSDVDVTWAFGDGQETTLTPGDSATHSYQGESAGTYDVTASGEYLDRTPFTTSPVSVQVTACPPAKYTVTVTVTGSGSVTIRDTANGCTSDCASADCPAVACTLSVTDGDPAELDYTDDSTAHSYLQNTGVGGCSQSPCSLGTVSGDISVSVTFGLRAQIFVSHNGSGTVSGPDGCSDTCWLVPGSATFTASPSDQWLVGYWSTGDCAFKQTSCTISVQDSQRASITVGFVPDTLTADGTAPPQDGKTASAHSAYDRGSNQVTTTLTASTPYLFVAARATAYVKIYSANNELLWVSGNYGVTACGKADPTCPSTVTKSFTDSPNQSAHDAGVTMAVVVTVS